MSHFTSIKTNITDQDLLIKTLDNLKLNWAKQKTLVNSYNKESKLCDIVIKQKNGHEIGFEKGLESYELVYDEMFWNLPITVSSFNDKLNSSYALNLISKNLLKHGFEINSLVKQNDYSNVKIKINALRFN
jgi:hypothetical protein